MRVQNVVEDCGDVGVEGLGGGFFYGGGHFAGGAGGEFDLR